VGGVTPPRRLLTQGPPLERLGIDPAVIAHPRARTTELRARLFARPSTALALGAHAPVVRGAQPARVSGGAGYAQRGHGRR
jgi:hypothetical protein